MERPPDRAFGERSVGGASTLARRRQVGRDDGVEGGIVLLDTLKVVLQKFQATDLAPAHAARELLC